ncbi:MAG: hypothetical protein VR73_14445 [Gammaproteobacteria bacterium BRH_c0]|nr:MAG: hypothetical protein VR73_14445 [Gammaproteobacteria bacterium BRH_c0]
MTASLVSAAAASATPVADNLASGVSEEPRTEKLMRFVRETRQASQMASLPSAIPGEADRFIPEPTGLLGLKAQNVIGYSEQTSAPTDLAAFQTSFVSLAEGPVFISFGPMMADGDFVVDEWESQMYCSDGTLYNNYYLILLRFDGDDLIDMHMHQDTMHVNVTYGQFGPSKAIPVREPRRPRTTTMYPAGEIESPFEIVEQFDLKPELIRDVTPGASGPAIEVEAGRAGNKALIQGLRKALAAGSQSEVNSFFGKGYRHFIAGDAPFGWNHLPLQEIYAPLVEHLASPLTLRYGPVLADDTRAFEQMMSFARLDDGTVFHNWHALVHEIRDGKIVQTREYLDTAHVWGTLGRWADWGKQLPTAPTRPRRSNLQGIAMTVQYKNNQAPDLERWEPFPPLD